MPNNSAKKKTAAKRRKDDIVTMSVEFPGVVIDPMPVEKRKGFKITDEMRAAYASRDKSKDDPDAPVLPPEKWANAMRRDEFFRPIKKQTTVRIDADVLDWLKSKGEGHLTRINEILREQMLAETRRRG